MNLRDLIPDFTAFKSATKLALEESKNALAVRDKQISDLTAQVEALKVASAARADDSSDADSSDSSDVDKLVSELKPAVDSLVKVLSDYTSDESDDSSDTADTSDSSDTSDTSDSTDASTASAKAVAKQLKAVTAKASKLVAAHKASKDSFNDAVVKAVASLGLSAPVAVAPEGKQALTPAERRARAAASFNEQLNSKK